MKTQKQGRTAKTRSISLDPEVESLVEERIAKLRPQIKGFSHYIQLLIDYDLHRDEKGKVKPLPFEKPLTSFSSNAVAVMN